MPNGGVTKVTLHVSTEVLDEIKFLADARKTTVTEVFAKALALEVYCSKAVAHGCNILIESPRGKVTRIIFPDTSFDNPWD